MKPKTVGRTLGIGLRVAGRMAGKALAGEGAAPGQTQPDRRVTEARAASPPTARAAGRTAGRAGGSLARGVGGFLRPFGTVGRKLWLEVVGVFFLLPVLVFGPVLWKARASWEHGPDHRTFLITAVIVLLFLYLAVTSFWRAWRK